MGRLVHRRCRWDCCRIQPSFAPTYLHDQGRGVAGHCSDILDLRRCVSAFCEKGFRCCEDAVLGSTQVKPFSLPDARTVGAHTGVKGSASRGTSKSMTVDCAITAICRASVPCPLAVNAVRMYRPDVGSAIP